MRQPTIAGPELLARARALFLGMAGAELRAGQLRHTAEALALAESLLERDRLDEEDLLRRWAALPPELAAAPGSTTEEALQLRHRGFPRADLAEAAARLHPERSGDAALPRVLPIAIAASGDAALLKEWAAASSALTHADHSSQVGAVAACLLARDLLTRDLDESLLRVGQALLEELPPRMGPLFRRGPTEEWPEPGRDAFSTLAAALDALRQGPQWAPPRAPRPMEASWLALTGGLLGASGVASEPPPEGLPADLTEQIDRLAEGLAALAPERRSRP